MEYALDPRRRPARAVRGVAAERLDRALESLASIADDPERSVHETRKRLKELRALLRLVHDQMPVRSATEAARLRDAARVLAEGRDAHVLVRTFDRLADTSGELPPGIRSVLAGRTGHTTDRLLCDLRIDDVAWSAVRNARSEVAEWRLDADGFDAYGPGLRRTYAGGRRRLDAVLAHPDTEELHSLRTSTKRLWYQVRLLRAAAPELLASTIGELDDLGELLGDDHDLAVLVETLQVLSTRPQGAAGVEPTDLAAVVDAAAVRRRRLQTEALPRLTRLYAERPTDFVDRFGAWWRAAARPRRRRR
jgi:CHAD domain-containing protein